MAISDAGHAKRPAAGAVIAEALLSDPGWVHVVPEEAKRRAALRALMRVASAYPASRVRVAEVDGVVAGVAVWVTPGAYPFPFMQRLLAAPRMIGLVFRIGGRIRDIARFGSSIDAAFPDEPVRYLQALGVGPAHRGQGIGSALLDAGLAEADAAGESAYLETSLERNVGLYRRHGFAVLPGSPATLADGGPVMWRMQRPAR